MIDKFLGATTQERSAIIRKYADEKGLNFGLIEKDIWVCYALNEIFHNSDLKDKVVFKGGTCLAKAHKVINRFSEDVDIGINKEFLDIRGTSKRPEKIAHRLIEATKDYSKNVIYPELSKTFTKSLGKEDWSLVPHDKERDVFLFKFPSLTKEKGDYSYIKREIKLEFKALGEIWPSKESSVKPYITDIVPDLFKETKVQILDLKRNFLEKLFILDSVTRRPEDRPMRRERFSRHYYDVYSIIKSGKIRDITKETEIFNSIVENVKVFPRESWVDYDKIKSVSDLKIIPSEAKIVNLRKDYNDMGVMFFGKEVNDFDKIIKTISEYSKIISKKTN